MGRVDNVHAPDQIEGPPWGGRGIGRLGGPARPVYGLHARFRCTSPPPRPHSAHARSFGCPRGEHPTSVDVDAMTCSLGQFPPGLEVPNAGPIPALCTEELAPVDSEQTLHARFHSSESKLELLIRSEPLKRGVFLVLQTRQLGLREVLPMQVVFPRRALAGRPLYHGLLVQCDFGHKDFRGGAKTQERSSVLDICSTGCWTKGPLICAQRDHTHPEQCYTLPHSEPMQARRSQRASKLFMREG